MANFVHEMIPRSEDDGYARGKRAMVVTAVLTSIAAVIVAMRLFARLKLMKSTGLEDWSILISLVFSIIYLSLVAARKSIHSATNYTILIDCTQNSISKWVFTLITFHPKFCKSN